MITARPRGERGVHQAGCGPREPGCHLKGSGSATPNACAWFNPVSGFRAQPNGLYPKPSPTNAQRSTTSGTFSGTRNFIKMDSGLCNVSKASMAELEVDVRTATGQDALAFARIYAPFVTGTAVSFEENPPDQAEMRHRRIAVTFATMPWLAATSGGRGHRALRTRRNIANAQRIVGRLTSRRTWPRIFAVEGWQRDSTACSSAFLKLKGSGARTPGSRSRTLQARAFIAR